MTKKQIGSEPIYDARALGTPRMLVLGLQHMFAMFGATVLVPALTGLDVATTLLFAGLGTLLFHLLTKRQSPRVPRLLVRVPRRLRQAIARCSGTRTGPTSRCSPYACFGVACGGSHVRRPRRALQGLRREEGHAFLPARSSPAPSSSPSA